MLWVGDKALRVHKGQLHRLDLTVVACKCITWGGGKIVEPLENVERDQGGKALAIRWDLPHLVAAIRHANRRDPRSCMACEVIPGYQPTSASGMARNGVGQVAGVDRGAARLSY